MSLFIFEKGTENIKAGEQLVKIQLSINTEPKHKLMMVYNKEQSIFFERNTTKAVKKFMSGGLKRYAIIKMDRGGGFSIVKSAPKQDW